jgi:hypothetical protein
LPIRRRSLSKDDCEQNFCGAYKRRRATEEEKLKPWHNLDVIVATLLMKMIKSVLFRVASEHRHGKTVSRGKMEVSAFISVIIIVIIVSIFERFVCTVATPGFDMRVGGRFILRTKYSIFCSKLKAKFAWY